MQEDDEGWVDVEVTTKDYGVGPTYYVITFTLDSRQYTVTTRYAEVRDAVSAVCTPVTLSLQLGMALKYRH